ncbi:amino acid adenylation domain-containing protein [Laceyella putida]|uniref:non-ribosomal peptide synthetase n=1 Tax=Laceyella putida TaxID=110101 RepID=UPI00363A7AD5
MSYNELVHPWRKGRAYYREYLRGYNEGIQIIPELKSGNLQVRATMRPEEVTFYLDSHLTNEIIALADKMNVTVSTLLSLMWGVLLQKYNNTNDVVFASISPGSHDGDEELAVQLRRVQCASGETIYDLVAKNMGHPEMTAIPLSQLEELTGIAPSSLQHLFCVMETGREDSEDTEHKAESEYDRWLAGWKDSHLVLHVLVTLGGQLTMRFKFDETRFHPDWIERVGHHFARVVQSFVYCPELVLHELELMADAEKEKLLYGFNDTKAAYPGDQTIHALFEQQVQRTPDQVAVVFKDEELTYRQLDERANQLAHALRRRGVGREQIVGILVRPSLEMIIGVLGVLKAGAAYLPIDPQYPLERIDYMLQDSRAAMLLTQTGLTVPVEWRERKLYLDRIAWEEGGIAVEGVESTPNHLAYVIYTSGSTGKPKGVMVEHRALVNLASWHVRRFEVTAQDRAMKYAGFGFDASVWEVFPYLIAGATLVVIPEEIRLDVEALNRYMEEEGVTICFLPTPVAEQFMRLENRSLTRLLTGGDRLQQVRPQTYRLFNNYGPTENAVVATCFEVKPGEPILIGKPIANNQAYVVSEEGSLQPIGVPGELCLAGDSLARGYLHQKELTLDRFVPNPFVPGERMYKTGDLVRWLPDGNLEFLGRIDDQVKIRGYRVELGEIGSVLLRHPSIEDAVVITRTDHSGQPVLCAYVVAGERVNEKELRAHLARDLPEYMIPTHFVLLDRLPLTPNGKVDKKVLPEPVAEKARPDRFLAPVHPVEVKLAQLWQEVLQVDHVGLHDHFFALGGHSLKLMMLATRIRAEFGVEVDFVRLFHHPTLSEMASLVQAADSTTTGSLQPVAEQAYYPVTSVQRRLYAVEQLENIGVTYHNPVVLELAGELDGQRLRQSLQAVVDRHEALRTSFHLVDGELMQKVESEAALPWEQFEVKNEAEARERIQQLIRPFDLSRAPLIRAGLLQLETERHVLVLDIHHIVSDAVSIESILYHELGCLYRGETLPAPAWQYKEVAVWHEAWKQTVDCQKQGEYWSKQFADEWPVLDMPTDYPRPNIQQFSGGKVRFSLDVELAERLKRISEQEEATLFMVLLATYKLMLAKLSGQDDLVVGFPIAGRSQAEAEQIFGMFVNTLPLRTQPISERSFSQYLAEVKDKVLSAYSHGDYPLEEIVEKRGIARDRSRNPLFDTVFVLQNVEAASLDLPGIAVKAYSNWEWKQSMFDMTWEAEEQETIHFAVEYNTALFSRATIERLIGYYSHLLRQVVADPERSLGEFDIVPEAEKERLLTTFNATEAEYPRDKTLHQCFAEQVKQTPDLPAVVYRTETLTYRELDARANRLARRLRDRGAEREQIIGIMVRPSLEMVVSVLGVLKSGAAYLPIDVDYPTERIMYMLEDSQARLLLAERGVEVPAEWLDRVLWLDELDWMAGDGSEVEVDSQPNDLAYVIYTSGSTGKPKGVMVEHRSVLNLAAWHIREFAVTAEDRATKYAGFGFDASVWEIYPYLLTGATLYVIPEELRLDVGGLNRYMEEQGITISFLPTQLAEQFMQLENKSLKTLLVGGDRLQQLQPQTYRVVNNYGPTENTVVTTSGELSPEMEVLPIGKPIANNRVVVLGADGQLVPIGVPGELCVSGESLARGYLHRPELTAEKFVPNPFVSGERMYKTGDRVRWLPDGSIEFLGRLDDQVKVRGFRIELGEVTNRLLKHPAVREAVVIARRDEAGEAVLCAYFTAEGGWTTAGLRQHLAQELPDYMIPAHFIKLESLPLNANGKVDKRALPEPEVSEGMGSAYVAPTTELERLLARIWKEVLGVERIGIHDNFFALGGDSIKAIRIVALLNQHQLKFETKMLFRYPTIAALAPHVQQAEPRLVEADEISGEVELTPIQQWFFAKQSPQPHHFNQAMMLFKASGWEAASVMKTFEKLVQHHDALRMGYRLAGTSVTQWIRGLDAENFTLEEIDLRGEGEEELEARIEQEANRLQQSLSLEEGPLVRVGLFKTDQGDYLLIVIHHLVVDGVSWRILMEDFKTGYEAAVQGREIQLPEKTHSFQLWASKCKEAANSGIVLQERNYWKGLEALAVEPLPKDLEGTGVSRMGQQQAMTWQWDRERTTNLLTKAHQAYNTDMNDLLLAALCMTLKKWAGQERIAILLEGHGREEIIPGIDLSRTVGWFTSMYPVVFEVDTDEWTEAIPQVKETLRRIPNKGVGYGLLQTFTKPEHKQGLSFALTPEISFNYLGQFAEEGLGSAPMPTGTWFSPETPDDHALSITAMVVGGELNFIFSFNREWYLPETMERLVESFRQHLQTCVDHCLNQTETVRTPSDFGVNELTWSDWKHVQSLVDRQAIQDVYALSPLQRGMMFHALQDRLQYFEQFTLELTGRIDVAVLEESLRGLVQKHEMLRTVFLHEKLSAPVQVVLSSCPVEFEFVDLTSLAEADRPAWVAKLKTEDRQRGFASLREPLFRFVLVQTGETQFQLLWSFHHLLFDGWCIKLLLEEWLAWYQARLRQETLPSTQPVPYRHYIEWLDRQDHQAAQAFWQEYLQGVEQKASLFGRTDGPMRAVAEEKEERIFTLPEEWTVRLNRLAQQHQVTMNTVLQTLWGVLLQKMNGVSDVVFGAVVSGRPAELPHVDEMVGLFINTVPVRIRGEKTTTFAELLQQVQQDNLVAEQAHFSSLAEIQANTPLGNQLFDHIIAFENYPLDLSALMAAYPAIGFEISRVEAFEQDNYAFSLVVYPGEQLTLKFMYAAKVFAEEQMEQLFASLQTLIRQVVADPERSLGDLDIVPEAEKERLLTTFNATEAEYPRDKTLHQCFAEQVKQTPDQPAVVYRTETLTYRELDTRANRLARRLRDRGAEREQIIGIMVRPSLEMVVSVLGVLKSGAAYLPIDADYPTERIMYMLEDSQARLLLAERGVEVPAEWLDRVLWLDEFVWMAGDGSEVEVDSQPNDLAYVIYTSGSTGKPKGVMVEHRSVLNLAAWHIREFAVTAEDRATKYAGFGFDASVWEIYPYLLSGATLYVIPEELRLDVDGLNRYMEEQGITISFLPTQLAEQFMRLENKSLKTLLVGGDRLQQLQPQTYRVVNNYGPTENTVVTTSGELSPEMEVLPIGKPIANNRVVVLGADGQLVPIGVPGELCVSGESLARGYLHRPELTAEKFVPNPFVSGERMYKTGDRVRWLPDGSIEFLGRLDDQVKVRGFRIELGEVTNRLLKHPAVREAVVIARRDEAGEAVLCAYFTAEGGWTTAGLRQHLAQELPDYMIPAHFIKLESLPLNANGKVDKRALPEPEVSEGTGSAYVAPTTELEAALAKIWQNVLQVERVGINDRFFELGGHSLKAMMLSSQIHKELDMEIPLREIFVHPTVREMAAYLAGMDKKAFGRIEPAPPQVYYPVTSAQKRLYVIQQMDGVGTSYHMPYFFRVQGTLDPGRLEEAIGKLVERHESLRTSFHLVEGELMQQVQAKVTVSIQYEQAADQEEAKRIMRAFIRPFDLERAPLFRVGVIDVGTGEAILMWDLHHIVADGISMSILFRDFARFYQGGALPELPLQYKDVAAWQQSEPVQTAKRVHETYWLRELAGELPVLELPTDFPRPPVQRYEGAYLTFTIDERLSGKLKQLAEKQEATPYMILLAAYTVLLSKYSGQEDIIVGTPVAGRSHADLQEIVGMFVNTLALRSHPKEEQTFLEFLAQMKDRVLAANEHQDYPLEELIEKLGGHRDMSRTPLFDTTFGMQNMEPPVLRLLPGLTLTPGELEWNRAKFDLSWILVEGSSLTGMVEYSTSLFTEATVQRMIAHYLRILEQIVEDPAKRLAEVELATEAEKTQILTVFNATEAPYPDQALAHQLFEEQVERSPEQLAVVYKDVALTYREVNARANQLARVLRAQGVTSDQIVGLMMKRSHECIIAMLAVMKAGGAYLPIDPEYPESRINYLLEDSQAKWLLVTRETEVPVSYRGIVIVVDEATYATEDRSNLVPVNEPEHLVYMIYTSGSTGKPKGVMIQHRSLCNLSLLGPLREIEPHSRVMQFASISFDSSVAEIFPALFMGATLYLEDRELLLSELTQYLKQNRITTAALPPSVLRSVPYEELPDLKTVISAGEACTLDLVQVWGQGRTFINEYGPTEGTVCATLARLTPDMAMVPIGKPIKNQQVYIVNRQHQLQPVGVVGELCIGGAGLARGYWNRPDLTAEKFVHNPFVPGERMYKTGDLARWLPDGSIEYLGRVDDQVKIRGHRIELGEVTARLLDHPVIKEAVVTARKDERGQSALCAYFTVAGPWSIAELRRHLAKELPDYMIPSHFIELDRIPLTPHGKVDKRALPEPVGAVETGVEYVAPTTEMERLLAESWRKVLGLERVGIHDHFLELGGDSIKAIQVVAHLKQHDYKVKINDLFQYPTIAGLATRVQTSEPQAEQGLVTGEVPLTPIQSWFFDKKFAEAHHWNQAMMLYRETGWEAHAVERVLHALITHHDALRMVYRQEGEQVKQFNRGLEGTCFAFEVFDLSAEPDVRGRIEREAGRLQRQHRLAEGPLLQVGLFRTATGDHLLFSIHHLVIDGVSWRILLEDFATAYEQVMRGKPIQLPPKTSSFQAWSRKLREYANSPELLKELDYWRRIEAKPIPAIPKDLPGEAPLTTAGCKTVTVTLSEMETRQLLTDVHAAYHTEMNDVLLTALALAVNRWGHSHALAVNMEGHGREEIIEELDLMRTVGWFTSTYPVVIELETEQISDAIKLVKEQLRKIPNKGIGYGILKYLTDLAHKQGCSFLAEPELSFNYLGQFDQEVSTGAFSQSAMPKGDELSPSSTTPHLLNIVGIVLNQRLELHFHYHTSVHRHETIANLAEQVKQWLQEIIRHCLGKEEAEMTPSDFSSNDLTFEEVEEISELLAELDLDE